MFTYRHCFISFYFLLPSLTVLFYFFHFV